MRRWVPFVLMDARVLTPALTEANKTIVPNQSAILSTT